MTVSRQVIARKNGSFTHLDGSQFIYCEGSCTTFGLSSSDLAIISQRVVSDYVSELTPKGEKVSVVKLLTDYQARITAIATNMHNHTFYASTNEVAEAIVALGVIPTMFPLMEALSDLQNDLRGCHSKNLTAFFAQRRQAIASGMQPDINVQQAEALDIAGNIANHFSRYPHAETQCREFIAKQEMMREIAELRSKLYDLRFQRFELKDPCNEAINLIDHGIIGVNLNRLPKEYELIDYFETFVQRVYDLTCQLNFDIHGNFINEVISLLNGAIKRPKSEAYISSSTQIYQLLSSHVSELTKFTRKTDFDTANPKKEQIQYLLDLLPLIECLNAASHPFARNGLFGQPVTSAFHTKALNKYHQVEKGHVFEHEPFVYTQSTTRNTTYYTDADIKQLLFGASIEKARSTKGIKGRLMARIMSDGATVSDSDWRGELLGLPSSPRSPRSPHPPSPRSLVASSSSKAVSHKTVDLSLHAKSASALGSSSSQSTSTLNSSPLRALALSPPTSPRLATRGKQYKHVDLSTPKNEPAPGSGGPQ